MASKLGKKNTAKRKIQMRQYFEKQAQTKKHFSDPFTMENDDTDLSQHTDFLLKEAIKIDLKLDSSDSSDKSDDILAGDVNLDDADYFISSLKLPKKKKTAVKKPEVMPKLSSREETNFKQEAENLKKLREKECIGEEEEDENLI